MTLPPTPAQRCWFPARSADLGAVCPNPEILNGTKNDQSCSSEALGDSRDRNLDSLHDSGLVLGGVTEVEVCF